MSSICTHSPHISLKTLNSHAAIACERHLKQVLENSAKATQEALQLQRPTLAKKIARLEAECYSILYPRRLR